MLLPFRPNLYDNDVVTNIPVDPEDVKRVIEQVFPKSKPIVTGNALDSILNKADVYTLAGVLKWCWARLPGGVITWKFYERFKEEEKRGKYKDDAYNTLVPRIAESPAHARIITQFFVLLFKISGKQKRNGLHGRKLARLAGFWAFELLHSNKEAPTNFGGGLTCWSKAAEACFHMYLAFLRTLFPKPGKDVYLPRTLEELLVTEQYPPKPLAFSQPIAVPKITLTVGRLSASPMVLLKRVAKAIKLDEDSFTDDEYNTLCALFEDPEAVEHSMSAESKRILVEITKENDVLGRERQLKIKDTVYLPYDVRCKTWSKYYNHACVDPVTGELHRPLTNYVYEAGMRDRLLDDQKRSSESYNHRISAPYPSNAYPTAPYPTSPVMGNSQPLQAQTWENTLHYYNRARDDPRYDNLENWNKQRKIAAEYNVTCKLARIDIDDFFVWVWMSSLSPEQTEVAKALFGRSVVVEVDTEDGRRWVVVEEILHPKPPPMKLSANVTDLPLEKRAVSSPVKPVAKPAPKPKVDKKPVRFEEPKPKPQPVVTMPEPEIESESEDEGTTHIKFHFDNMDPLVNAVAERLKRYNTDHQTQTDVVEGVQTEEVQEPDVSADDGNSKGCQTTHTVSRGTEPQVSVQHSVVQDIRVSPSIEAAQNTRKPQPSRSYEDVINAIPYLNISDDVEPDSFVTPILSSAPYYPIAAPSASSEVAVPKKRAPRSPPSNAEHFVVSIDTSHDPTPARRVVSMPTYPQATTAPNYRDSLGDSDDELHTQPLVSVPRSSMPQSVPAPAPISAAEREAAQALEDSLLQQTPRTLPSQPPVGVNMNMPRQMPFRNMAASNSAAWSTGTGTSMSSGASGSGSNLRWSQPSNPQMGGSPQRLPQNRPPFDPQQQGPGLDKNRPRGRSMQREPYYAPGPGGGGGQVPRNIQQLQQYPSQPGFDENVPRGFARPPGFAPNPASERSPSGSRFGDETSRSGPGSGQGGQAPHPYRSMELQGPDMTGPLPPNSSSNNNLSKTRPPHGVSSGPSGPGYQQQPSPDSFRDFGYGSDTNYRYDPHERPQDSPDSGYTRLPLKGSTNQRNMNHGGGGGQGGSNNGSDSDVSRGSIGPSAYGHSRSKSRSYAPHGGQYQQQQQQPRSAAMPGDAPAPKNMGASGAMGPPPLPSIASSSAATPAGDKPDSSVPRSVMQPDVTLDSIPHQSFRTPSSMSIPSSAGSAAGSKWSDVRSNLSRDSDRNKLPVPPLPVVIEANPRNPTSAHTLVGTTSPEDYYAATVKTIRRPSINTGDHVRNIVMKDNHNSNVIGRLPSATTYDKPKDTSGSIVNQTARAATPVADDEDEDSDDDFTTAFLPSQAADMYKLAAPEPKPTQQQVPQRVLAHSEQPLYPSTHASLLGDYAETVDPDHTPGFSGPSHPSNTGNQQRRAVSYSGAATTPSAGGMAGLSSGPLQDPYQGGGGVKRSATVQSSEGKRVSRFSIQGLIDASKKKKK